MRDHRFFAAIYDCALAAMEQAGLERMRAELLGQARGRTLELGAGTGLNLDHYGEGVTELVLTEPDRFMARKLRDRVAADPPKASVVIVEAPAERLPLDSSSFDSVVSTLCLCTVEDPEGAVDELVRVLRPGGRLLFLEHVRDPESARWARWQDRLERPWGWLAAGCHPNRATGDLLKARSELEVETVELTEIPNGLRLMRPAVSGAMVKA